MTDKNNEDGKAYIQQKKNDNNFNYSDFSYKLYAP